MQNNPDTTKAAADRIGWKAAAVVFVAAAVVRPIYTAQMWKCPLFQFPTIDAGTYYVLATRFADGNWLYPTGQPYWQPPVYSALLALWMKMAGDSVLGIKIAQLVLGSVNCVLVAMLGARVFSRRIGIIAGSAAALYGPMIYFDGELLTPTVQIFLNLCSILLLMRAVERRSLLLTALSGLILGVSVTVRPDVAVFVPAALVWMWLALRVDGPRKAAASLALFLICVIVPIAPIAIRNAVVGKDHVLISSNGGLNFYIGNNAHSEKTLAIRPGPEWDDLVATPRRGHPGMRASAESAYFYRKGFDYIRSHPLSYAGLMAGKVVAYVSAIEGRRNHDLYFYRNYSPLYAALTFRWGTFAFPFGIVLPLAILGIIYRPRRRETALLLTYIAAEFLVTIAFFVTARYRITAVPVLLIFAAFGAVQVVEMLRREKPPLAPILGVFALLILCNLNLAGVDRDRDLIESDNHYFLAGILHGDGKTEQAIPEYRKAISLNPDYALSRLNYARALVELERYDEAVEQLQQCLRLDPNNLAANAALGDIYYSRGDLRAAEPCYEVVAKTTPEAAEPLASIAQRAYQSGDMALAGRAIRAAVAAKPDYPQARHLYGAVLMAENKPQQAVEQFKETTRLDPTASQGWLALGAAYLKLGKTAEANAAFAHAAKLTPARTSPHPAR